MPQNHKPHLESEVLALIEWTEDRLRGYDWPNSLHDTRSVCRCFLISICDVIRGAFGALRVQSTTAYDILTRSLVEEIVDLKYIALKNDTVINRRFANFHVLKQYWMREQIEFYRDQLPRMIKEYQEYISAEFSEELSRSKSQTASAVIVSFEELDKYVKNKYYRTGWSGLTFQERLDAVNRLAPISPWQSNFSKIYRITSDSIHPTPYSMIPHFNPTTRAFKLEYSPTIESLRDYEERLFWFLDDAVDGMGLCFMELGENSLHRDFERTFAKKPKIQEYLKSLKK